MKLISTIASAFLVLAISFSAASAADPYEPPRTSYTEPVAANDDWNGGYVGGLIGWAQTSQDARSQSFIPETDFEGLVKDFPLGDEGATFGIQIGADQQLGPNFVVGAVVDHSWTNIDEGGTRFYLPGSSDEEYFANSELYGFGTARLRAGYLPDPRVLVYATGGLAWGLIEGSNGFLNSDDEVQDQSNFEETKFGWTVGVGAEVKPREDVRVKIEYLYADLGDVNLGVVEGSTGPVVRETESKLDLHTVRLGVAYEF